MLSPRWRGCFCRLFGLLRLSASIIAVTSFAHHHLLLSLFSSCPPRFEADTGTQHTPQSENPVYQALSGLDGVQLPVCPYFITFRSDRVNSADSLSCH